MATRSTLRGESRVTTAGLGLAALLVALALLAWLGGSGASQRTALRPGPDAIVRLGIANEPPYGYLDTASGRVTGEAPEVARVLLERLGVRRIEVVATEFRSLIPGLRAGRFDVIAAGMYVTPARCAQVLFSRPTYRIGEALLVRRGNPKRLHALSDLARDGSVTLGVVGGSIELSYAEAAGVPAARIVTLKDASAAVDSLRAGHIDAYAGTALTTRSLLDKTQANDLELAEPFSQPVIDGVETFGYGAFAFRKRDRALRDAFDAELDRYLGSAEHLARVRPFGFTARELPGAVRTEALCARRGSGA
jgi:polar amino acid transport system substrate-binding protein